MIQTLTWIVMYGEPIAILLLIAVIILKNSHIELQKNQLRKIYRRLGDMRNALDLQNELNAELRKQNSRAKTETSVAELMPRRFKRFDSTSEHGKING